MIKTKKIQLTPNTFFLILLNVYFKKKWWFIVLQLTIGLFFLVAERREPIEIFIIVLTLGYPPLIAVQYWRFANSKENKIFLLERDYEIFDDKVIGNLSDGTSSTILIEHFVKVIRLQTSFLHYISKNQFIYIPKNAFKTEAEKIWFEQEIIDKIKS